MKRNEMHKQIDDGKPLLTAVFLEYNVESRDKRDKRSQQVVGKQLICRTHVLLGNQSFTRDEFAPDGVTLEEAKKAAPPVKRYAPVVLEVEMIDARGDFGAAWRGRLYPLED